MLRISKWTFLALCAIHFIVYFKLTFVSSFFFFSLPSSLFFFASAMCNQSEYRQKKNEQRTNVIRNGPNNKTKKKIRMWFVVVDMSAKCAVVVWYNAWIHLWFISLHRRKHSRIFNASEKFCSKFPAIFQIQNFI